MKADRTLSPTLVAQLLGALLVVAALDAVAGAQRTFVASYGSATNTSFNCSLAKPCRAFSEALGVTNLEGEIIVLDSAGYGTVTINQSVSIIAPPGVHAGIAVFSGDGIIVDGSGINVTLRGLSINGQGGAIGIDFQQGAELVVEGCEVANMTNVGIAISATNSMTVIDNSILRADGFGGVIVQGSGPMRVAIDNSKLTSNINGVAIAATGGAVNAHVSHSTLTGNGIGIQVQASSGASASVLSDGNSISYASFAAFNFTNLGGSEIVYTAGNNAIGYVGTVANGGALTPCCAI